PEPLEPEPLALPQPVAQSEVIETTEPTPESALDLDATINATAVGAAPEESDQTATTPDELTDTTFGRAVQEFAGDSLGEIIESPAAPATGPETSAPIEPTPAETASAAIEEPQPPIAPPPPISEVPKPAPYKWGANQENFLGGVPVRLPPAQPPKREFGNVGVRFDGQAGPGEAPARPEAPVAPTSASSEEPSPIEAIEREPIEELKLTDPDPPSEESEQIEAVSALIDEMLAPTEPGDKPKSAPPVIPPPPPRGSRPRRSRRGRGAESPAGRDDERIPPFTGLTDPAVESLSAGFDGLAMSPVRETDVFSQMSPPGSDEDAFGASDPAESFAPMDAIGVDSAPARPRARTSAATARVEVPRGTFFTGPEPGTPQTDARRRASVRPAIPETEPEASRRPPVVYTPEAVVEEQPQVRRRKVRNAGALFVLMILLMGAAAAAIYYFLPPEARVEANVSFTNFAALTQVERNEFHKQQQELLGSDATRRTARRRLSEKDPEIAPGFLDDQEKYLITASDAYWPDTRKGLFVLVRRGSDKEGDRTRMRAISQALYEANRPRADEAARIRHDYEDLAAAISKSEQKLATLKEQIEQARSIGESRPTPEQVRTMEADVARLENEWNETVAAVKSAQAEVQRLRQSPMSAPDAAGAPEQPVSDDKVKAMEQELADVSGKLDAARAARTQEAQKARKALDDALAQFQQQIESARGVVKDSPELSEYVNSAQKLQETTRQLIDDLVRRQEQQFARLTELKTRLSEKMEQRRAEQFQGDEKLRDLTEQLELKKRQYNAAVGGGMKKEADDLKADIDLLTNMIKARQELLPRDSFYAEAITQLEEIISTTSKNVEEDRKRTDALLETLQKSFANNQSVQKLPEAQKAIAGDLEKRLSDINAARQQYNVAVAAASADDDTIKPLETQIASIQGNINQRRKTLADNSRQNLSAQQEQTRQDQITSREQELTRLNDAEASARQAYFARAKDLRDAQITVESARSSTDKLVELQNQKSTIESQLSAQNDQVAFKKKELDRVVEPLAPGDNDVHAFDGKDNRLLVTLVSGGAILVVFGLLILMTLHGAAQEVSLASLPRLAPVDQPDSPTDNGEVTPGEDSPEDRAPAVNL
ncbi:MAG: hypothetical protein ACREJC_01370, partial [Tepidisphaeraceae bacterium]